MYFTDQSLRHGEYKCRRNQIWIDTHINKSRNNTNRVVGVDCRKDNVPRKCSLDCKLCCFLVADFSHHDDVRVLPHHRAQGAGKTQFGTHVHLDLRQARDADFHCRRHARSHTGWNALNKLDRLNRLPGGHDWRRSEHGLRCRFCCPRIRPRNMNLGVRRRVRRRRRSTLCETRPDAAGGADRFR